VFLYTSSKRRIPAQGKPACIGCAFTAISPTALNLSSHTMTLSASSRSITGRPLIVKVHLLSSHIFCFFWAALSTSPSADPISFELGRIFSRIIARSRFLRSPRALSKRLRLRVFAANAHGWTGDALASADDRERAGSCDDVFSSDTDCGSNGVDDAYSDEIETGGEAEEDERVVLFALFGQQENRRRSPCSRSRSFRRGPGIAVSGSTSRSIDRAGIYRPKFTPLMPAQIVQRWRGVGLH
jgi:hypothetical protein